MLTNRVACVRCVRRFSDSDFRLSESPCGTGYRRTPRPGPGRCKELQRELVEILRDDVDAQAVLAAEEILEEVDAGLDEELLSGSDVAASTDDKGEEGQSGPERFDIAEVCSRLRLADLSTLSQWRFADSEKPLTVVLQIYTFSGSATRGQVFKAVCKRHPDCQVWLRAQPRFVALEALMTWAAKGRVGSAIGHRDAASELRARWGSGV